MITREHVRQLLDPRQEEPRLLLLRGQAVVVPAAQAEAPEYAGALEVAGGGDLGRPPADGLSDGELDELAARLRAVAEQLGA